MFYTADRREAMRRRFLVLLSSILLVALLMNPKIIDLQ